ncbi:MAG: hypothetical protein AAFO74_08820 [Pseudomonadota bacterium]
MSFNLGNWWEQLNLDILNGWQPEGAGEDPETGGSPDLDLPDDYHDEAWDDDPDPYGLTDPAPDPEDQAPGDGTGPIWNNDDGPSVAWPFDWP